MPSNSEHYRVAKTIKYEKGCLKHLRKLDRNTQTRILNAINMIPFGDIKPLHGSSDDYRLRVGDYRIIFSKDNKYLLITIIEIASHGEIYKRL